MHFSEKVWQNMKNSHIRWKVAVFQGFSHFLRKMKLFIVAANCSCSANFCPKNNGERAFESCGSIFCEKIFFVLSSPIHPHLCWFLCVIEDKWRMRKYTKAKQKNCAKVFFKKSKIEGDDPLKNYPSCCWKYFETILLSRTKPYVHISFLVVEKVTFLYFDGY